jgi:predicted nucleic acid-binding protein
MMVANPPYGGSRLLVDTSAWTASRRAKAMKNTPQEWVEALWHRQFLTSPIVRLELLHSARTREEFEKLDDLLDFYEEIALDKRVTRAAMEAVRRLARSPRSGNHRVGLQDALIAASATVRGVGVLHYNHRDFDRLASVLDFECVALAPPGTFER